MTHLLIAFALFVAAVLLSLFGSSLNGTLLNVDYVMVVPFFYFLIIAFFPRWEGRKLEASIGGILVCIVIYALIDTFMDMHLARPILATTLLSALITYLILKLVYKKKSVK